MAEDNTGRPHTLKGTLQVAAPSGHYIKQQDMAEDMVLHMKPLQEMLHFVVGSVCGMTTFIVSKVTARD